jgi:hypothetical protein
MKISCLGRAFVCVIPMIVLGCHRASPVWDGTWKLNESKSSIPGPNFSITISPEGEYHLDNGTYNDSFRCDGKEYSTKPNRTMSCLQTSAFVIDTTSKENGVVATTHWELSPDGRMLTLKRTSIQADGSVKPRETVYSHTSGSSIGFAGGWTNTKRLESRPQLVLVLKERSLHIAFPESGQFTDPALDGSDAPIHGPGVPQRLTMAIRPHGRQEFLTVKKVGDQIINQGSLSLSADGRILVEEYWSPSAPDQKATLVYEKQ